jgi:indole-3-glycerol phosphate synthase
MMSTPETPDLLAAIVAATRKMIAVRSAQLPIADLERSAAQVQPAPGRFAAALSRPQKLNIIAECKRRSPSRGVIKADYDPASIARAYERSGAAAISVLTEPAFFDGHLGHLADVRAVCDLPLLRKDFIVDPYQILEARAAGADAVLLIVAALTPSALANLHRAAADTGLEALVEIHDVRELPIALDAGASIIGVNNRNLRTLSVDTEISRRAVELIPDDVIAVAESGLKSAADLSALADAGYDAFLIGERLMAASDPGQALAEMMKGTARE